MSIRNAIAIEATEAAETLKTSMDIREYAYWKQKKAREEARNIFYLTSSSMWFLARQGLALQRQNSDSLSNFIQLWKLRDQDKP